MTNFQFAFLIGVLAVVYTNILTEPGMIFSGLYNWLDKIFKTDERQRSGKGYHPAFMILIHCEKCFAGQFAFWYYVWAHENVYIQDPISYFLGHIFFTALSIYFAFLLNKLNKHINNE